LTGSFPRTFRIDSIALEMGEELAFVVRRAPPVHPPVPDGGLEGGGIPGVQGLGRLDVIMPVDQQGALGLGVSGSPRKPGEDSVSLPWEGFGV